MTKKTAGELFLDHIDASMVAQGLDTYGEWLDVILYIKRMNRHELKELIDG